MAELEVRGHRRGRDGGRGRHRQTAPCDDSLWSSLGRGDLHRGAIAGMDCPCAPRPSRPQDVSAQASPVRALRVRHEGRAEPPLPGLRARRDGVRAVALAFSQAA